MIMADNISIREFIKRYDAGHFGINDVDVQCQAGWYDWFCKASSLRNKTIELTKKLKTIIDSPKINQDTMYVFFKNNCPVHGRLYDSFSICDMETGDVKFWISPSIGYYEPKENFGKPQVASPEDKFEGQTFDNWKSVVKWFMEN
jgi:hypothetical protein